MHKIITLLAASAALAVAAPASGAEVVLFNQTNLPQQFATNQSITFTASDASTILNFQGYDQPGTLALVNLFFATSGTVPILGGSNNLLAGASFTPTASGCSAPFNGFGTGSTGNYGTSDLTFGGTCAGLYDTLSTSVNTTIGQSYTLTFRLTSSAPAGGTGLRISAGPLAAGAVPEPATWAMMLLGFGGIGFAMRRQRKPALQAA